MRSDGPFGFLLITTDPTLRSGATGSAYELVRKRLALAQWPLYKSTRHRSQIEKGARVAFYVAGHREHHGEVIASALVQSTESGRGLTVDPQEYFTDPPAKALRLIDVLYVDTPVPLRPVLPSLSFCPRNLDKWGAVVLGGAIDISDPILLLEVLFGTSGVLADCETACDGNDDGVLNLADCIGLLAYVFAGGFPPDEPFPECGTDPTPDSLSCDSPASCP